MIGFLERPFAGLRGGHLEHSAAVCTMDGVVLRARVRRACMQSVPAFSSFVAVRLIPSPAVRARHHHPMTRRVPPHPVSVLTILTLESVAQWKGPPSLPSSHVPTLCTPCSGLEVSALVAARRGNVMSHT